MRHVLENTDNLVIKQGEVAEILVETNVLLELKQHQMLFIHVRLL